MSDYVKISALVLAGQRPGGDPLAAHFGVATKALIPVAGVAMIDRVIRALQESDAIGQATIAGPEALADRVAPGVERIPAGSSIAATMRPLVGDSTGPMLITTADHALLDPVMITAFIAGARGHDLAVGLVSRTTLLATYPGSKRTWLRFRGGSYSGANLFWIGGPQVLPLIDVWAAVEQQRKRGRALIGAFGPLILTGIALRLLTLEDAMRRIGRRFGLTIAPVVLSQPEACIDVDSIADHALAETILAGR